MAAPETQRQAAGIAATGYSPVVTQLAPPIHLPETGALWAQVGQTALGAARQAGDMFANSPLNPAVRAQLKEAQARANAGLAIVQHAMAHRSYLYGAGSESPQGASIAPPIAYPVQQQVGQGIDYSGSGDGSGDSGQKTAEPAEQPTITRTGKNTGKDQNGKSYYETQPGSNKWTAGTPPPVPPSNLNVGMSQGGLVQGYATGGPVSIWSPPRLPLAPPAPDGTQSVQQNPPTQPLLAQPQPPMTPSPQDMANWQAQNAQPVADAGSALDWAKRFHTGYKTATYLPHGGPNSEPAYNFSDGKSSNIVPISQMVKNGFGPTVAAQSTSSVLSASDRIAQQGQGATGPGLPLGPVAPAQPGQGQPPAPPAPGQGPQYPTIAQDQTAPGQPPPAPGAYNAAAYQMPQGATVTQTGAVNPALMAGGSDEQALAASRAAKENATSADLNADASSAHPVFNWQTDENGKVYTDLPEDAAHPFLQRRFYKGSTGFVSGQGSADDWKKQQIFDNLAGPTGVPLPKDTPRMDEQQIRSMSPDDVEKWLRYIRDYTLHAKAPEPTDPEGQGLTDASNAVKAAQRIKDKILWMKQNNIPMETISNDELIRSKEAGWAASSKDPLTWSVWNTAAHGGPKNNLADELNQDYKNLNAHLAKVPGGTYPNAATPKPEEWGGKIPWTDIDVSVPKTTDVSTIDPLNKIGSGDTHDQALAHAQEVLDNATGDYKKIITKLPKAGFRVPDEDQKNLSDLTDPNKGYIEDPTNKMWDANHQKMVNGYGPVPHRPNPLFDNWISLGEGQSGSTPSSSASPTPTHPPQISAWDTKEFERLGIKTGQQYLGPDGRIYTRGQ